MLGERVDELGRPIVHRAAEAHDQQQRTAGADLAIADRPGRGVDDARPTVDHIGSGCGVRWCSRGVCATGAAPDADDRCGAHTHECHRDPRVAQGKLGLVGLTLSHRRRRGR